MESGDPRSRDESNDRASQATPKKERIEEEVDEQAEQKEKGRLKELKKSKNSFMKDLVSSGKKDTKKKEKSRDDQMKDLINQAEKYASFLLSKHKMHNQG
jgi:hypothetical protein